MSTQFTNRQWRLPNNENKDKQSNYSMDFDGTQSVDVGTVTINNSGSFSIWFKISNIAFYQNILGSSNASGMFKYITLRNGTLYQYVLGTGWIVLYSTSLDDNEWHNLIFTYDSTTSGGPARGTFKSYVDGVLTKTYDMINDVSEDWSSSTFTSIAYFGTTQPFGPRYFDGKIDGVSIFNYALTDGTGGTVNQIAALYGSSSTGIGNPMSLSPKPVAYYPLGDQDAFNGADYLVPNSSLKDYVFDFDKASSNYIDFNSIDLGTTNTISFWHKRGITTGNQHVLGSLDGTQKHIVYFTSGYIYIRPDGSTQFITAYLANTPYPFPPYKNTTDWANYIVTRDGDNIKLYLNGVEFALSGSGSGMAATTVNRIGTIGNSVSNTIDGELSNIQFFNTALPATGSNSVETLYNNGSPLTSMTGFTSLQGWWKLDASDTYDSSTGNWTIEDHAGSNDGTSSGMTQANLVQSDLSFTSGYSPYALDFDSASTSYVNVGNNSSINSLNQITGSVWAKFTGTSNDVYAVFANWGSSTKFSFEYQKTTSTNSRNIRLRINYGNNTKSSYFITYADLSDDNWHHLVFTIDGTTNANGINIYVDGAKLSSFTATNTGLYNSSVDTLIGSRYTNSTWDMEGPISNVSVWNTDLTSAQVTEIYNEGVPSNLNNHSAYSNLVSWWQLGSNSSFNTNWTVLDEKGTNNGTSVNMTEDAIVDGVGSYANGLSSGMGGDEVIGDAPYSTANALSVNMDVEDRVTDTPS